MESIRDFNDVLSIVNKLTNLSVATLDSSMRVRSESKGEMDVEPARKKMRVGADSNGVHRSDASAGPYLDCLLVARNHMTPIPDIRPVIVEIPSSCPVSGGVAQRQKSAIKPDHCLVALPQSLIGVGVARPLLISEQEFPNLVTPSAIEVVKVQSQSGGQERQEWIIANRFVQARICASGRLSSLVVYGQGGAPDRESIQTPRPLTVEEEYYGEGNRLLINDDLALFWEAWDTDVYSTEKEELVLPAESVEIVESGPLRSTVLVQYPLTRGGSKISQYISLSAASGRLDFRTLVLWKESRKILRVSTLCTVRADRAAFDSQFGFINRPTHANTKSDAAKFEVVGHKYACLSEYGFSFALLNDSKYGYGVRGSDMRLSLLRSPKSPDDTCDMGDHTFTFSLLGQFASFPCREVTDEAAALNWAPIALPASSGAPSCGPCGEFWLVRLPRGGLDSVVLSAVKELDSKEIRNGSTSTRSFIVRLFEGLGGRGRGCFEVSPDFVVQSAALCNLLEDETANGAPLNCERNVIWADFNPFQIITVRVTVVI